MAQIVYKYKLGWSVTQHSMGLFTGNDAIEKAKKKAEKDHKKKIKWSHRKSRTANLDVISSEDLGYIMYHILERKTE